MKKIGISITALAIFAFMSCKDEKKQTIQEESTIEEVTTAEPAVNREAKEIAKTVSVPLEAKSGSSAVGEVFFSEKDGTVRLEAKISGLDSGTHAIHIHEKSDCSSADGKSAGGHWNPTHAQHGKWGDEAGYHKGDIGNFEVTDSGLGKINMETDEWCIGCGDETKDILGKAIIVHQGADDFVSQPSGAAGSRVSCGGIIK